MSVNQSEHVTFLLEPRSKSCTNSALKTNTDIQKLLFICSRNKRRSYTAEKLLAGTPHYQVRSAGTQPGARVIVTEGHLGWADIIFCMEKSHVSQLRRKFPEAVQTKRVVCLHIPDDYEYMQPELVEELQGKLGRYLAVPEELPKP